MALSQEDIEAAVERHLPNQFQEALLRATFQAHDIAHRECLAAFAETEAENVVGYYRRGKMEQNIRNVAERFPTMSTTVSKAPGSGWNHTEVRSGPVVLTESAVPYPCAPVDPADFRVSLAAANPPPPTLFDDATELRLGSIYAILVHSRYQWNTRDDHQKHGHLPGSAYLAVPYSDLDDYACEINLFDKFPNVVRSLTPQEWDESAVVLYIDHARKVV